MTIEEYRNHVLKKFRNGQEIDICVAGESGKKNKVIRVIIDQFFTSHVSVIHKGHRESFSYLEMYRDANAVMGRPSKMLRKQVST